MIRSQTGDSRGFQKVWSKKQEPQRRSGSGKEVLWNIVSVEANGTGAISVWESGSQKSTRAGACQQKASRATLPLTALCQEKLASGKLWLGSGTVGLRCRDGTIKRAELTAFLCFLRKVCGPIKVHVDNKGTLDGLQKRKKEGIKPGAGDADLWIKMWEELHELVKRGILVEVAHVKAHRTKKEKDKMTQFERFVTEGNELAKARAMLDEGFMADVRADTFEAGERERRCT